MKKRSTLVGLVVLLLSATTPLYAQTFTAQIQQFWNQLRTGVLVFTNIMVTGGTITGVTITPTSPLTVAKIIGGTTATSTLTLQSTSGAGIAGSDIILTVGNNGATEMARVTTTGFFGVGGGTPAFLFHVIKSANDFGSVQGRIENTNTGSGAYSAWDVTTGANNIRLYTPSQNVALQEGFMVTSGTMAINFGVGNAAYWQITGGATIGNWIPYTTNANDLGNTTHVVRTGYFGTSVFSPKMYGGTGANGTLQLVSTSGTGDATGAVKISGGTNGATLVATFNNDGTALFSGSLQSQSFNTTGSIVSTSFIRAGIADATAPAAGDLVANRGGNPGTGVLFFGGSANLHYLFYDGTNFLFSGNPVNVGTGSLKLAGVVVDSLTAPTIASGGCTSPAVTHSNGTAGFLLTIGTSCTGVKTIVLTLPASAHFWRVACDNNTSDAQQAANYVVGRATSTTAVTITNYARVTGVQSDFTASDTLLCNARAE